MKAWFSTEHMVKAPQRAVRAFHHSHEAIKWLSPPLIPMQVHRAEALGEGAITEFTLWFGPFPVRWVAQHVRVGMYGFTDIQLSGPFKRWVHSHRYVPATRCTTLVEDHIEYSHHTGLKGVLTRLLFSPLSLKMLFAYRRRAMERGAREWARSEDTGEPEASEELDPAGEGASEDSALRA